MKECRFSFVRFCIRQGLDDRLVCDMQSSKGDWSPQEAKRESKWAIWVFYYFFFLSFLFLIYSFKRRGEGGVKKKLEMGNGEVLGKSYNNRVTLHCTWFDHTVTKQIFLDNPLGFIKQSICKKPLAEILVTPKQVVIPCDFCSVFYYQKGLTNLYPKDTTNWEYQTFLIT